MRYTVSLPLVGAIRGMCTVLQQVTSWQEPTRHVFITAHWDGNKMLRNTRDNLKGVGGDNGKGHLLPPPGRDPPFVKVPTPAEHGGRWTWYHHAGVPRVSGNFTNCMSPRPVRCCSFSAVKRTKIPAFLDFPPYE